MTPVDSTCFIDTDGLSEDDGEDEMKPWPGADLIAGAIQPTLAGVFSELGVERSELESAASVLSSSLLVEKGASYFPRAQLEQPCRLLFELTMARNAADPHVFSSQFSSIIVGVGLQHAPDPKRVERAQKVMEDALEAAGLSGLTSDEESEDEE
jgi:hypothetical protein